MNPAVEAQSLSSLNHLLANPPQYPRNPTHEVLKPLILYIVRVPGSQDVFLTPLKPPTKASISLEAIQSSLYYLHVETPDDEQIRMSIEQDKQTHNLERAGPTIRRKPLQQLKQGGQVSDEYSTRHSVAYSSNFSYNSGTDLQKPPLVPIRAHTVSLGHGQRIARKPLGPRGLIRENDRKDNSASASETESDPDEMLSELNQPLVRPIPNKVNYVEDQIKPPLPPRHREPYYGSASNVETSRAIHGHQSTSQSRSSVEASYTSSLGITSTDRLDHRQTPAVITLIRRDPASGAQWNIGSISPLNTGGYASSLRPIAIELDSPGYTKFMHQIEHVRPRSSASNVDSFKEVLAAVRHRQGSDSEADADKFTRKVEFRQQATNTRARGISRSGSGLDAVPNHPIPNKPQRSVFSFVSPWQGLCAFNNGIDGKSLKCRHSLSPTGLEDDSPTVNVAELRFNLPWSVLSPRDTNNTRVGTHDSLSYSKDSEALPISHLLKEPRGKEAWRRSVQHLKNLSKEMKDLQLRDRNRENRPPDMNNGLSTMGNGGGFHAMIRSQSSDSVSPPLPPRPSQQDQRRDEEYRISLKLGREKAGGGFKGNSAKLGKLIIEDEGLKMGDLVVAACMGVWWQHYMGMVG